MPSGVDLMTASPELHPGADQKTACELWPTYKTEILLESVQPCNVVPWEPTSKEGAEQGAEHITIGYPKSNLVAKDRQL